MDDYYYYDFPDGDEDSVDIIEDYDTEPDPPLFTDELHNCILPSATQVGLYVLALLGWNLLLRIVWTCTRRQLASGRGEWLQHLASVVLGFAALYFNTGHEFLIVLFLSLVAYVLMLVLEYRNSRHMGAALAVATIGSHFLYELLWNQPEAWHRIRGLQMVATMKIVSLAFDLESAQRKLLKDKPSSYSVPALVPYLGYIFCPATCVSGPWLPYAAYLQSLRGDGTKGVRWILWTILNAVLAVVFLCLSNCIVPLLCTDRSWLWVITYRDALAVRCSHYFICFLSQATMATAGVTPNSAPNALLGHMVSKPWRIEFPRSLSSLVRCWNIPMHDWLKTYVFRSAHQRFGSYLAALLSTYLVSSLLHGIYLKIYLVLLSLACFAYVESVLRAKLADIFSACITASGCQEREHGRVTHCRFNRCRKRIGWRSFSACTVVFVNFLFGALTVLHLAYLGVMMHDFNFEDEDVTAAAAGLWNWSKLNYLCHWVTLISYIFYYLI